MIDFHCHLDLYSDPNPTLERCQRLGLGVLSVTTTPSTWPGTSQLAMGRPLIRTALGLHPQLAKERRHELPLFDRYLPETKYVGEVGLDGTPHCRTFWADQEVVFNHMLGRCEEAGNKILTIHSRKAATPVLDALDLHPRIEVSILHWFSGTQSELRRAVDRGCWFSIGPTMLRSTHGRNLVEAIPRDKILLETDGPLTSLQNKALRPWDTRLALRELATLWKVEVSEVEETIANNEDFTWSL